MLISFLPAPSPGFEKAPTPGKLLVCAHLRSLRKARRKAHAAVSQSTSISRPSLSRLENASGPTHSAGGYDWFNQIQAASASADDSYALLGKARKEEAR
jgi:hypothetical protein